MRLLAIPAASPAFLERAELTLNLESLLVGFGWFLLLWLQPERQEGEAPGLKDTVPTLTSAQGGLGGRLPGSQVG